ncbi:type III-A CRISPR-associated RAMP protein Csm4, partial [Staphylococcus caprae]
MATKVFKLSFKTPVHFGKKRLSDGEMTITADTLFSALFIETLQLGKDTD